MQRADQTPEARIEAALEACISEGAIARLAAGELPPDEHARLVDHLEGCDECREVVTAAIELVEPPRVIGGRYVVQAELGRGGMGVVFRAYDPVLDRDVAVKLLLLERAASDIEGRLVRESRVMARLRHPQLVQIHDAGRDEDGFFIAMEYVPGCTLRRHLAERPRSVDEIVALFSQVGEGLAAAHAIGVIHRDFKPDNVLVDEGGHPKVADFGLAGLLQHAEPGGGWTQTATDSPASPVPPTRGGVGTPV